MVASAQSIEYPHGIAEASVNLCSGGTDSVRSAYENPSSEAEKTPAQGTTVREAACVVRGAGFSLSLFPPANSVVLLGKPMIANSTKIWLTTVLTQFPVYLYHQDPDR